MVMGEDVATQASGISESHVLLTGLTIGESPRWHGDRLWFSNWGAQEIITVDISGRSEIVLRVPTTIPFCLDWLPDGRLLVVSGPEGLVLRQEPDGSLVTHADLTPLSDRAWNEIVVDGRGNAYVNGGGFDLLGGEAYAPGVIALVTPDGTVRQVADGIAFPNGMAVAPDNATLLVAESYARQLTVFDIAADGTLSNRRVWAALDGHPDGICLDAEGTAWYADVPNQRCVRVREGGEVLQTVVLDRGCFACMLGGPDRRTLFMMAAEWHGPENMFAGPKTGQVLAIPAPAPGIGWP
jgi:sugar lactone lactonase YvrE